MTPCPSPCLMVGSDPLSQQRDISPNAAYSSTFKERELALSPVETFRARQNDENFGWEGIWCSFWQLFHTKDLNGCNLNGDVWIRHVSSGGNLGSARPGGTIADWNFKLEIKSAGEPPLDKSRHYKSVKFTQTHILIGLLATSAIPLGLGQPQSSRWLITSRSETKSPVPILSLSRCFTFMN